jgi:hypothetical protein
MGFWDHREDLPDFWCKVVQVAHAGARGAMHHLDERGIPLQKAPINYGSSISVVGKYLPADL